MSVKVLFEGITKRIDSLPKSLPDFLKLATEQFSLDERVKMYYFDDDYDKFEIVTELDYKCALDLFETMTNARKIQIERIVKVESVDILKKVNMLKLKIEEEKKQRERK